MNTTQLDNILTRILPKSKVNYLGIFAQDEIPTNLKTITYPACFLANTDPSTKPGSHWVAFFLSSPSKIDFFDSYGFHPRVYGFSLPVTNYNHTQYQTFNSKVCGQFSIFYLYSRIHCRCSLDVQFSKTNLGWNDSKVAKWLKSYKLTSIPSHPCTTSRCVQTCKCHKSTK